MHSIISGFNFYKTNILFTIVYSEPNLMQPIIINGHKLNGWKKNLIVNEIND